MGVEGSTANGEMVEKTERRLVRAGVRVGSGGGPIGLTGGVRLVDVAEIHVNVKVAIG